MDNGERRSMGTMTFRVKRIPKPSAQYGSLKESGTMTKSEASVQAGLSAFYENFDFNIIPKVKSFKMTVQTPSGWVDFVSNSNMLTPEMKQMLNQLRKNQKILFEEIRAVGPDGIEVKLPTLSIRIN
jgi:hypothetical protein